MKCFLDMDGVLVNFVDGACAVHGIPNPFFDPETRDQLRGKWDFIKELKLDPKKFWKPLGFEFWRTLKPTEDCFQILQLLEDKFKKENICILSSPCATHGCTDGKTEWLREYLPYYAAQKHHLFGSAKHFLSHSQSIMVDDGEHNIDPFIKEGGLGILVPRLWNRLHKQAHDPLGWIEDYLRNY